MKSEEKITAILCYMANSKTPCRVTELSKKVNITKSSVCRILMSLANIHWVAKLPSEEYILGDRAMEFSLAVLSGMTLRNVCLPFLEELNDLTKETVGLSIRKGMEDVCIDQKESKNLVRHVLELGYKHPLWSGASGKVILAYIDEKEKEEIFDHIRDSKNLVNASGHKIDIEELKNQIDEIRKLGYHISVGERTAVTTAIAAPIFNRNEVMGSIIITGPLPRFDEKLARSHKDLIINTAKKISIRLGSTN